MWTPACRATLWTGSRARTHRRTPAHGSSAAIRRVVTLPRYRETMAEQLVIERLLLRSWRPDDAEAALSVYGDADVARWLSPAVDRAPDAPAMRLLLQQWAAEDSRMMPPAGRWAIERLEDKRLIGGAILLPLPPGNEDLEMGWQ